jgi:hypothetical protein
MTTITVDVNFQQAQSSSVIQTVTGIPGSNGVDGKSAYQTWLELGNTGTEADFIASLQGSDGTDGADGTIGKSAYQTWLELGNTGTEADFIASLQGSDGAQIDDNAVSLLSTYSSNKIELIVGNIEAALDIILGE